MTMSIALDKTSVTLTTITGVGDCIVGFTVYDNMDGSMTIHMGLSEIVCNLHDGETVLLIQPPKL
jgi:hypothetical protein